TGSADAKTIASAMRMVSAMCRRSAGFAGSVPSPSASSSGNGMIVARPVSAVVHLVPGPGSAATKIERREGAVLTHFDMSFAPQFQRGGEGTGDRGRPFFRRRHVVEQKTVERRPVLQLTDEPDQDFARLLQRPHRPLLDADIG